MTIALIADIHANWPALDAVFKDIKNRKVREVWCLGDLIGYGPYPNKVVSVLKARADHVIAGNYDLKVLRFPEMKGKWKTRKPAAKYFSFEWTSDHLSGKTKTFLKTLASVETLDRKGFRFLLVHGSPAAVDDPVYAGTPRRRLTQLSQMTDADVILCGHTHRFFDIHAGRARFINPGSVGRPFDADPRASYALLKLSRGRLTVEPRRVAYDLEKTLRKMRKEGFPKDIIHSIRVARSLDDLQPLPVARKQGLRKRALLKSASEEIG